MINSEIALPPRAGKGPQAIQQWKEISESIIGQWLARKTTPGKHLSPQDNAAGFLKRECYRVVSHYIEKDSVEFFERIVRLDGRALPSTVRLRENPFHYGLLALFSDDSVVSRQDRSLFSNQMLYARRHRVQARHLIGFIYQSGSNSELRRKLKSAFVEPGFTNVYLHDIWHGMVP